MNFSDFYHELYFDVDHEVRQAVRVTQGDKQSRGLKISVVRRGLVISVTDLTMVFKLYRHNNSPILTVTATKTGNIFTIEFPTDLFVDEGTFRGVLVLTDTASGKITDKWFKVTVDSDPEIGAILAENKPI